MMLPALKREYRVWVLRKADNRLIISLIRFIGAY